MSSVFDRSRLSEILPDGDKLRYNDFKEIVTVVGSLRLSAKYEWNDQEHLKGHRKALSETTFDKEEKRQQAVWYTRCATSRAEEIEKGPAYLISTYARIQEGEGGLHQGLPPNDWGRNGCEGVSY